MGSDNRCAWLDCGAVTKPLRGLGSQMVCQARNVLLQARGRWNVPFVELQKTVPNIAVLVPLSSRTCPRSGSLLVPQRRPESAFQCPWLQLLSEPSWRGGLDHRVNLEPLGAYFATRPTPAAPSVQHNNSSLGNLRRRYAPWAVAYEYR